MLEYIKFHCNVLEKKEAGKKTPEIIMNDYLSKRKDGIDFVYNGIECIVQSVKYASGRACIITKILRKKDVDKANETVCTE